MSYSLFLYPHLEHHEFEVGQLLRLLSDIELIAETAQTDRYRLGARLMEQITFLGCSPALRVGEIECRIILHHFDQITGLGGDSIETIHFPRCKHPITTAPALLSAGPADRWACDQCDNRGEIAEINWRKSAAFSDWFIEISSIFPKEAIPSADFIDQLGQLSRSDWSWFYSKSSFNKSA